MSDEETLTFLILKYGSIERAFSKWLTGTAEFSEAEDSYLKEHAKKIYPNLSLVRNKD